MAIAVSSEVLLKLVRLTGLVFAAVAVAAFVAGVIVDESSTRLRRGMGPTPRARCLPSGAGGRCLWQSSRSVFTTFTEQESA
jgi:hypothetical protein